jgi:hypothetical protein
MQFCFFFFFLLVQLKLLSKFFDKLFDPEIHARMLDQKWIADVLHEQFVMVL